MRVTNTERMAQLSSAIDACRSVLAIHLKDRLDERVSPIHDTTVGDLLTRIGQMCLTISGATEDSKYYYADLDIGYTEDDFPTENRKL